MVVLQLGDNVITHASGNIFANVHLKYGIGGGA